jgi:hypothetical protein
MRDIRSVQQAYIQVYGIERNFALNEYKDSIGRKLPEYHLTKSQTVFLVSGFG